MAQSLSAHPLVVGLAMGLSDSAVQSAITAMQTGATPSFAGPTGAPELAPGAVRDFGTQVNSPELRTLSGYLGGEVPDPGGGPAWQIMFVDSSLAGWLIVRTNEILYSNRVKDHTAAGGERDYIWLTVDTMVGRGDSSSSAQAVFLSGAFTRAGDFPTSPRGDTFPRGGGLLFDAITPGCCTGNSR
jgi:hypothetical protein